MMKYDQLQPKLKAFAQHGILFDRIIESDTKPQGIADCFFCGKRQKLYVNAETGVWDCKTCGKHGNLNHFLKFVGDECRAGKIDEPLTILAENRKLAIETFRRWNIGWNGREYTLPIPYPDHQEMITDLRRYQLGKKWISTVTTHHGLFGFDRLEKSGPIYYTEGEWDAMALDECLRRSKNPGCVLAGTGGANTFKQEWAGYFRGRDVILVYDNDRAGREGEHRTHAILKPVAKTVKMVHWDPRMPEGFDFRDFYKANGLNPMKTLERLTKLFHTNPRPLPNDDSKAPQTGGKADSKAPSDDGPTLEGPGLAWDQVVKGYRQWLEMPNEEPLLVIIAACMANRLLGDPLWLFLVAPPGGSKSELLMSLDASDYIVSLSQLTPHALISGQKVGKGMEDPSLLPRLNNRMLIVKDFTAIMGMNETDRENILGQLRDAYDGKAEKYFGTGEHKTFRSKFGVIAGVTPAIEKFANQSVSLGERFLKYRIRMSGKVNVGTKQIMRAIQNTGREAQMREQLQVIAEKALNRKVDPENPPKFNNAMANKILCLAQLIAALRGAVSRARYTNEIEFLPTAEIGTRLAKQFTKLGMGLAITLFENEITEAHYRILARVAKDTLPDRILSIVAALYIKTELYKKGIKSPHVTANLEQLSTFTRLPHATLAILMQDLALLDIVEQIKEDAGGKFKYAYRLRPAIKRLIEKAGLFADEIGWIEAGNKHAKEED